MKLFWITIGFSVNYCNRRYLAFVRCILIGGIGLGKSRIAAMLTDMSASECIEMMCYKRR